MRPNWIDIENELAEIAWEVGRLQNRLARMTPESLRSGTQEEWEVTLVCASAAEKIYTGCERVMERLAADVDGLPVTRSDGWHTALLRRLANPFPSTRDAVLSKDCFAILNKLRAFRHRERNTYGINLDAAIVVDRAHEAVAGFALFRMEVTAFCRQECGGGEGPSASS